MSKTLIHCRTFYFEADFVTSLRCIPMAVRRKLDLCGCKVKLKHWLELSECDRKEILMWSDYPEELEKLAQR
ncbi:nitrate reductase associated protein, partial [Synechococcus sp. UW140]|uniref:nitrate reductase associated protein n=1 Tax=Synechococcus sp. UW140 TaxID=368503 RepID=UPI0025F94B29